MQPFRVGGPYPVGSEFVGLVYKTFRDLGIPFGAALVLIYVLLVAEFRNFIHPAVIMAPIPLTLIVVPLGCIAIGWAFDGSKQESAATASPMH